MTPLRVALEITPPKQTNPGVLLRRARLLGERASAVHVIQRSDRQPSVEAAAELEARGIHAVWHLVNRGRGERELTAEIEAAARADLRAALVVRGEAGPPEATRPPALAELVRRVRDALPAARVGVALNPYLPRERVLARLWPKLDAGAAFVQTQPIFEAGLLRPFAESIRARFPRVRVMPMLIPLPSVAAAERIGERLRVSLPDPLLRRLEEAGEPAGWREFGALARALVADGLADELAVMTYSADPPKAFAERLDAALFR